MYTCHILNIICGDLGCNWTYEWKALGPKVGVLNKFPLTEAFPVCGNSKLFRNKWHSTFSSPRSPHTRIDTRTQTHRHYKKIQTGRHSHTHTHHIFSQTYTKPHTDTHRYCIHTHMKQTHSHRKKTQTDRHTLTHTTYSHRHTQSHTNTHRFTHTHTHISLSVLHTLFIYLYLFHLSVPLFSPLLFLSLYLPFLSCQL